MVNFKEDERLSTLNHSCAHVMAQAVKHLYPHAKFWVGPVVKEGFYYDIDLGNDVVNDEVIAAIEKEMKKICKEGKKIYRREVSKAEAMEMLNISEPLLSFRVLPIPNEWFPLLFFHPGCFRLLMPGHMCSG